MRKNDWILNLAISSRQKQLVEITERKIAKNTTMENLSQVTENFSEVYCKFYNLYFKQQAGKGTSRCPIYGSEYAKYFNALRNSQSHTVHCKL